MSPSRSTSLLAGPAAIALAVAAIAGCGSGGGSTSTSGSPAPPKTANGHLATVGVANSGLGKILVDSRAHTLYLFKKDRGTQSACAGACASAWPPLRSSRRPMVGVGATASMVATAPRADGWRQVSYGGHPLYRYTGDGKPGDTNGQGLTAFGGAWFALSPSGNQVASKPSNPGGGY
jgi:predicted lipoprotein with Yx(FWY)xxD motif